VVVMEMAVTLLLILTAGASLLLAR
jgi:hypothetical protein